MNSRENNEMSIVFKNETLYDSERRFWQKYSWLLTVEGLKRLWTEKKNITTLQMLRESLMPSYSSPQSIEVQVNELLILAII
jgi:hypothetical protein